MLYVIVATAIITTIVLAVVFRVGKIRDAVVSKPKRPLPFVLRVKEPKIIMG
jgi:hypothetical protein